MNPKDDFMSCLMHNGHENIPIFIFDTSFGASILGTPVSDIYKDGFDPDLSARSISAGRRFLGHDGMNGATSCGDTRVFGAEVDFFPNRPPMLRKNAFEDPMSLYDHTPEEMDNDVIDGIVGSYTKLRELEPDAVIAGYTASPFLLAAVLRGLERVLMDSFSNLDYIDELMAFTETAVSIVNDRIVREPSCDCTMIPGAYDNVGLLGLESLRRICIPPLERMYRKSRENGLPCIFHPHGCLTEFEGIDALNDFMDIGFECIYYGEDNDHSVIGELTDGRCSIMGGIDTATTIFLGDHERIAADTSDVLKKTEGREFIFTCSCSVDANLERDKLKVMMDTAKGYLRARS